MTTLEEPRTALPGAGVLALLPPVIALAALELHVHPTIASGRRRASYRAVVTNVGAAPVRPRISLGDGDEAGVDRRLRAAVDAPDVTLAPGQQCAVQIAVRARRRCILRGETQHTLAVCARGEGGEGAPGEGARESVARQLVFVQRRSRGPWIGAVVLVLAAAAAAGVSLLSQRVAAPTVRGAPDAATAERALRAAGLQLDPRIRSRTVWEAPPGTILDQIPEPGTRLRRGTQVSVLVAVAARRAVVPALAGRTSAQAGKLLAAAGLTGGPVLPAGAAASWVVASQLPAARARVPRGTAVTLVVRRPRAAERPVAAPPAAAASREPSRVPAIDGRSPSAYGRAVAAAGLVPKVIRVVDRAPPGTLVGVRPAAGVLAGRGASVRLLVSAGLPQLAFDTGSIMRVFDPRSGRTLRQAAPPQGDAVEPSWSSDGRRVLYRVGRRLSFVSARLAESGRTIYEGKTRYAVATLAPAPARDVLALVRRTAGDGDLCFARIGKAMLRPRCSADKRWDLGRQISWRPDGRELLVFGVRRGRPGTFGILRYRSAKAFSTDPRDWRGVLATDASVSGAGAIAAAYAPSGRRVALVTNRGMPRFQVLLAPAWDLRDRTAKALPVRGCEVAWRPDGQELAVVQSDDDCGRPVGQIVRVDPKRPREPVTVSSGGRHPAYQPLTYAGPKGLS